MVPWCNYPLETIIQTIDLLRAEGVINYIPCIVVQKPLGQVYRVGGQRQFERDIGEEKRHMQTEKSQA